MSGYPQNRLITLWRTGAELLVCHLSSSGVLLPTAPVIIQVIPAHPLPVCRVRPGMDYQQYGPLWRLTGGGRETARHNMEKYLNTWLA